MNGASRKLLDDCFLHDRDRMRHDEVLELLGTRLTCTVEDENVALNQANGRILASDIIAPRNVPLADNSAVDGFAFAHAEYLRTGGRLSLEGRVAAGDLDIPPVAPATCTRIFTGATMPEGTDSVAMQEDCTLEGAAPQTVIIPDGLKQGANRRRAGEDLTVGDTLLSAGTVLNPAQLASLASIGQAHVDVRERLRIAVLSTGEEILQPGDEIAAGQVYDANKPMLMALAQTPRTLVTDLGHAPDEANATKTNLRKAASENHLILTTGGASQGQEDHIVSVLDEIGQRHLWQIAIKPGRPMVFGQINDAVVIGLPGNPVAAMICFLMYVRPAIAHLTGTSFDQPKRIKLAAGFEIKRKKQDRREFLRGWRAWNEESQNWVANKFERDGSGLISSLRVAEGLIELDEETDHVAPGDPVWFIPFTELGITR